MCVGASQIIFYLSKFLFNIWKYFPLCLFLGALSFPLLGESWPRFSSNSLILHFSLVFTFLMSALQFFYCFSFSRLLIGFYIHMLLLWLCFSFTILLLKWMTFVILFFKDFFALLFYLNFILCKFIFRLLFLLENLPTMSLHFQAHFAQWVGEASHFSSHMASLPYRVPRGIRQASTDL